MTGSDRRLDLSGKRLVVIVNRKSGKRDGPSAEQVLREKLAPKVGSFDLRIIDKGRDITRTAQAAVRDGADIVAVLGGDGTQTAVAGVLAGTDVAMAVLPTGTFNYFAREIGVGESWGEALEALLDGELAKVSVGEVNGRVFSTTPVSAPIPRSSKSARAITNAGAARGSGPIGRFWSRSRICDGRCISR
ncbi:acylglycerol kinase family protein [Paracoccus cavernae]|uniref:Acylglycerol kinase family protein n=1 Tax=Paracoccus cavernae TaxID=1571207 RepID=A0ABT8DAK8_9RHOB|nr:acylglycerol kinase family protein [Paracoccus cavernae]